MGCIFISAICSGAPMFLIVNFGLDKVESIYEEQNMNRGFQEEYIKDLQSFVYYNQITKEKISDIERWTDENTYVYLSIYQNNTVIFNSDYSYSETEELDDEVTVDTLDSENLYRLVLADGSIARVDIFCYDYWQYYYYVWGIGVAITILTFIFLLSKMIHKKIVYINDIAKELQILEGGNLEYPITIKGKDEISNLATGIEQMRLSIIENMSKEKKMLQANKNLVTAMSHDLRTPLTTLNGYLELLNMDHITDEEKRKHYLELSLAKTAEIKELSDELFEYFLIYGEDMKKIDVEPVSVDMLANDLIENQFLALEEEGFQLESINHLQHSTGNCMMNAKYMQRVLNNILSNLEKYAQKDKPIEISVAIEKQFLVIRVRNTIRESIDEHESTKIGLITCRRIMEMHQGEFKTFCEDNQFTVKLSIPMER